MRLIDVDKLNIYDVSPAYGTCVMGVTEEDIELAPTVEAVPVSYIQQRIDRLRLLAEYEAEASGGYIGRSYMAKFELEELIKYAEREQNDS